MQHTKLFFQNHKSLNFTLMKKAPFLSAFLALFLSCEEEIPSTTFVDTNVGESFKIELEANWATGYHWSWTNSTDISIADTTELKYISNANDLPGAVGKEIWTFKALAKGDETLAFMYISPGVTTNDGEKTRKIRVVVNK